jgi:hypothetical protein
LKIKELKERSTEYLLKDYVLAQLFHLSMISLEVKTLILKEFLRKKVSTSTKLPLITSLRPE